MPEQADHLNLNNFLTLLVTGRDLAESLQQESEPDRLGLENLGALSIAYARESLGEDDLQFQALFKSFTAGGAQTPEFWSNYAKLPASAFPVKEDGFLPHFKGIALEIATGLSNRTGQLYNDKGHDLLMLAEFYFRTNPNRHNPEDAISQRTIQAFTEAMAYEDFYFPACLGLINSLHHQKKYKEALIAANEGVEKSIVKGDREFTRQILGGKTTALLYLDRDEIIRIYEDLPQDMKDDEILTVTAAKAYLSKEKWTEAAALYDKLFKQFGAESWEQTLLEYLTVLEMVGRYQDKDKWAKKGLDLAKAPKSRSLLFTHLAFARLNLGDKGGAIGALQAAYRNDPSNEGIRYHLLHMMQDAGWHEEWLHYKTKISSLPGTFSRCWERARADTSRKSTNQELTPKPSVIVGLTIDLKCPAEGPIQILEFNALPRSGLVGYEKAYGHDLREREIYPWQESWGPGVDFSRGKAQTYSLDRMYCAEVVPPLKKIYADAALGAYLQTEYKDVTARYVEKNPEISAFFPRTLILPKKGAHESSALSEFIATGTGTFVLKPSTGITGNGVKALRSGEIRDYLRAITAGAPFGDETDRFWETDYHPNILLQDCVRSAPVEAVDHHTYDGTMRVAVTLVRDLGTGAVDIRYHGAYWKLPKDPCDSPHLQSSVISFPPCKLPKEELSSDKRPFSARVSEEDFERVKTDLNLCLPAMAPGLTANLRQTIVELDQELRTGPDSGRCLATEIFTTSLLGGLCKLLPEAHGTSNDIRAFLEEEYRKPGLIRDYMRVMAHDSVPRKPSDYYLKGTRYRPFTVPDRNRRKAVQPS